MRIILINWIKIMNLVRMLNKVTLIKSTNNQLFVVVKWWMRQFLLKILNIFSEIVKKQIIK